MWRNSDHGIIDGGGSCAGRDALFRAVPRLGPAIGDRESTRLIESASGFGRARAPAVATYTGQHEAWVSMAPTPCVTVCWVLME